MKNKYFYVACDAGDPVNPEFRHYFRLYKKDGERPILVEQGLAPKIDEWEKSYDASFEITNPYPNLD